MLLHEQRVRARRVQCHTMHAVADFCCRVRNLLRMQSAINWFPALSAVIGAKRTSGGDRDGNSLRITWIDKNRVQTRPACAWLPFGTGIAATQSGEFAPRLAAVFRFELP